MVGGVIVLATLIMGWHITEYPALSDDEGTYLAQAWSVRHGIGLAPYTYWYDHPPLGWMQLAALTWLPTLFGGVDLLVASGRLVMLGVAVVNTILVYVLARRLLKHWAWALVAMGAFALSPLSVELHRQTYLDNLAVTWMLAAFVLAASARRHLWHYTAAGCCVAISLLTKETMAVAVPAVVLAMWQGSHRSTRKFCFVGFASGLLLICGLYPLYAVLRGELLPGDDHVSLVGAMLFQLHGRAGSGSVFTPGTGANQVVGSWLYLDVVLPIFGALAALAGLAVRRLRAPALAGVLFTLVALRPNGYLPAMYVIQALPFFAIALAGAGESAMHILLRRQGTAHPESRWERPVRLGVAVVWLLVAVVAVVPRWFTGDVRALTKQANRGDADAVAWIRDHVGDPGGRHIVVDDAMWLDMVRLGFEPGLGAVWFYKLDLDPAVHNAFPRGWADIDYIVSSPIIRQDPNDLPTVRDVLAHSRPVAVFGQDQDRIEIREVIR